MTIELSGSMIDMENDLEERLKSFSMNKITIEKITGHLDEFDGGDIDVKFSNGWTLWLFYYKRSRVRVCNQVEDVIFEKCSLDCFTGKGIVADIGYGLSNAIDSVLNLEY